MLDKEWRSYENRVKHANSQISQIMTRMDAVKTEMIEQLRAEVEGHKARNNASIYHRPVPRDKMEILQRENKELREKIKYLVGVVDQVMKQQAERREMDEKQYVEYLVIKGFELTEILESHV